jgi:type IV secretion system protein VirB9
MRRALILAVLALAASPAAASLTPVPAGGDPRVRVVGYDPLQVVSLEGVLGYQTMIVFDPGERIENVAIGDSLGWQVAPNRKANLLFVKPMARVKVTNMTVVTNLRRYAFELSERPGRPMAGEAIYSVRFEYPAPAAPIVQVAPPPAPEPPRDVNHAYSWEGGATNLPLRVFDDGHSTYFRFADEASLPAIFAVEADRSEAAVNVASRDGYLVVERLARAFVLRRGKDETRIINDGFQQPEGSELPQRKKSHGWRL